MTTMATDSMNDDHQNHQQETSKTCQPDRDRLAALVEFAAAAGHEINNPLAVILGRTQLLLNQEKNEAKRQSLETIAGQAIRIRDMIGDVMLFADPPPPNRQMIDVPQLVPKLVEKVTGALQHQSSRPLPHLSIDLPEQLELKADRSQFQTVIAELLRNALHPSTEASRVILRICDQPGESSVEITVQDDGRGLTEQEAAHLFDPFYSGRQAGRGLGFGLCKVWRIVEMHQGTITIEENGSEAGISVRINRPKQ